MTIDGLRSPYEKVEAVVHFGRMTDKIRLHATGKLPAEYQPFLGGANPYSFDGRCCRFLRIDHAALIVQTMQGGTDEGLFQWACTQGRKPSEEQVEVWNAFLRKRGWRDESSGGLRECMQKGQVTDPAVQTFFDFIDADEGRPLRFPPASPLSRMTHATSVAPFAQERLKLQTVPQDWELPETRISRASHLAISAVCSEVISNDWVLRHPVCNDNLLASVS